MGSGGDAGHLPDGAPRARVADNSNPATASTKGPVDDEPGAIAIPGTACDEEGSLACGGHGTRDRYICRDGTWAANDPCKASERCQTALGSEQGSCQKMARECSGQLPGVLFCDGDVRKVCDDLIESRVVPCGNLLRCMPSETESAGCSCMMGAFDPGDGKGCQIATSCATGGGGCDPLTQCTMDTTGKPACTTCPPPYVGDGQQGCIPQLVALTPSCGELSPALTSGVFEYRLKVPLTCSSLQLMAESVPDTQIEVDGAPIEANQGWVMEPLQVGENAVKVAVTAASGKNSAYQLTVERSAVETAFIKASNARAGDAFGFHIAAQGNTLVVGAPYEDGSSGGVNGDQNSTNASSSGAAYVFVWQGGEWTQQAYLKAETPAANDHFGASVAVSGDTIVVGAPAYDPENWGVLISPTRPGKAHVFVRRGDTWSPQGTLMPSTTNRPDLFGLSVAVEQDTALVGAPDESNTNLGGGAVYAFTRSGDTWQLAQRVEPAKPIVPLAFGFSVALHGDRFIAGAPQDATFQRAGGSAYVFERSKGMWHETQHLQDPEIKEQATFGHAVAIRGDRVIVSAAALDLRQRPTPPGEVFLYELAAGTGWERRDRYSSPNPFSVDLFGGAIALTDNTLVVGCNGDSSAARGVNGDPRNSDSWRSGAAYLLGQTPDNHFAMSAYLKASSPDRDDAYGQSVAATADMVMVGAPSESSGSKGLGGDPSSNAALRSGAVYVYR